MRRSRIHPALLALFWTQVFPVNAEVKLPAIFSDHMVLQSGVYVPVWGTASPGESVAVTFAGQSKHTSASADGKWSLDLEPLKAGGLPQTLTVQGKNSLTVRDVLTGEVWLASGQSNMALTVSGARDFEKEKTEANFPQIRMFIVDHSPQPQPQADCKGRWWICAPNDVGRFSATAYFFGRELHNVLRTPVGLINASFTGTTIEAWTSLEAQSKLPEYPAISAAWTKSDALPWDQAAADTRFREQVSKWKTQAAAAKAANQPPPRKPAKELPSRLQKNHPANLFNGMIAPLIPYGIRGAIWYQGENNTSPAQTPYYEHQLSTLILDWRARWGGEFPFALVQLANFDSDPEVRDWAPVREAQLNALQLPNTGMVVTIDIGDPHEVHPKNKQDFGHRLAQWALGAVYQKKVAAICGPLPDGLQLRDHEIVISFKHADGLAASKNANDEVRGFTLAGDDHKWKPAQAKIEGVQVVLSNPQIEHPIAARYAWANNPDCNLVNGAGLPASPFRTDNWK